MKNTLGNEDQTNIIPNGDDDSITSKYDDSNVDQYNEITDNMKSNGDDETITSKNEYDDINQNISEPEANDNNDDFFDNMTNELEKEIQEDTTGIENTYIHQNKMPGKKVMHNGQMCIEMPNGHLYNMQGRRIK